MKEHKKYYRNVANGDVYSRGAIAACDPQVAVINPENPVEISQLLQLLNKGAPRIALTTLREALKRYMTPVVKPEEPKTTGAIARYPDGGDWPTYVRLKSGEWVGAVHSGAGELPEQPLYWKDFPDDVEIVHVGYGGEI